MPGTICKQEAENECDAEREGVAKSLLTVPLFFINMDRSTQRRATFEKNLTATNRQLQKHGIVFDAHRVSALDARCTSRERVKRQYLSPNITFNAACAERNTLAEVCCTVAGVTSLTGAAAAQPVVQVELLVPGNA